MATIGRPVRVFFACLLCAVAILVAECTSGALSLTTTYLPHRRRFRDDFYDRGISYYVLNDDGRRIYYTIDGELYKIMKSKCDESLYVYTGNDAPQQNIEFSDIDVYLPFDKSFIKKLEVENILDNVLFSLWYSSKMSDSANLNLYIDFGYNLLLKGNGKDLSVPSLCGYASVPVKKLLVNLCKSEGDPGSTPSAILKKIGSFGDVHQVDSFKAPNNCSSYKDIAKKNNVRIDFRFPYHMGKLMGYATGMEYTYKRYFFEAGAEGEYKDNPTSQHKGVLLLDQSLYAPNSHKDSLFSFQVPYVGGDRPYLVLEQIFALPKVLMGYCKESTEKPAIGMIGVGKTLLSYSGHFGSHSFIKSSVRSCYQPIDDPLALYNAHHWEYPRLDVYLLPDRKVPVAKGSSFGGFVISYSVD